MGVVPGSHLPEPIDVLGAGHEPAAVGAERHGGTVSVGKHITDLPACFRLPNLDAKSLPRAGRDPFAIRTYRNAGRLGVSGERDEPGRTVQPDDIRAIA